MGAFQSTNKSYLVITLKKSFLFHWHHFKIKFDTSMCNGDYYYYFTIYCQMLSDWKISDYNKHNEKIFTFYNSSVGCLRPCTANNKLILLTFHYQKNIKLLSPEKMSFPHLQFWMPSNVMFKWFLDAQRFQGDLKPICHIKC